MTEAWVKNLLELQAMDLKLHNLKIKLALIPKEKLALKERAAKNRQTQQAAKDAIFATQTAIKKAESDSAAMADNIQKLQQQSSLVKKNSEYEAMLVQIADCQKKMGDFDGSALENMDKLEQQQRDYRQLAKETDAANANLKDEFLELDTLSKDITQTIARLTAERTAKSQTVESATLERYEALLSKDTKGEPLCLIDNGICTNCHLRITQQTFNNCKKGLVTLCDNCMHLIYLDD